MIVGVVNANREATIRLTVRSANGQEHAIEAIIDTGFTGFLTLPSTLIASMRGTFQEVVRRCQECTRRFRTRAAPGKSHSAPTLRLAPAKDRAFH